MRKRYTVESSKSPKNSVIGRNKQKRQSMAQKGLLDPNIHYDIVCGEKVKHKDYVCHYRKRPFYFCSEECKSEFSNAPRTILNEFKAEIFTSKK